VITVTKADIAAGIDKAYHIMGAAAHDHILTITAAQFAMLAQNANISDTSTLTLAHDHIITISCA
jgi:hypothetical protein